MKPSEGFPFLHEGVASLPEGHIKSVTRHLTVPSIFYFWPRNPEQREFYILDIKDVFLAGACMLNGDTIPDPIAELLTIRDMAAITVESTSRGEMESYPFEMLREIVARTEQALDRLGYSPAIAGGDENAESSGDGAGEPSGDG